MARSPRPRLSLALTAAVAGIVLASGSIARAQSMDPGRGQPPAEPTTKADSRPSAEGETAVGRASILRQFTAGNPIIWPLGICSIVALGFALERTVALRRQRVIPRDFVQRFLDRLGTGKLDRERAIELCKANDSPVARVFAHAIRYWGQPAATIRQAIGFDAAGELADLRRNVRVLNGTATLAPLIGLLGTVIGMIESFDALGVGGRAGAGKGEQLAHGISLALMATAAGLGIAILSVSAYYFLLHRIDALVRDLDDQTMRVIDLIASEGGRPAPPPTAPTPPASPERWGGVLPGEIGRLESRTTTLGRADPA